VVRLPYLMGSFIHLRYYSLNESGMGMEMRCILNLPTIVLNPEKKCNKFNYSREFLLCDYSWILFPKNLLQYQWGTLLLDRFFYTSGMREISYVIHTQEKASLHPDGLFIEGTYIFLDNSIWCDSVQNVADRTYLQQSICILLCTSMNVYILVHQPVCHL